MNHSRRLDIALFSFAAVFAAALFLFACYGYPPPNGDSLAFIPPAISFARGDGLISQVWKYAVTLDETGANRFLNHGPYYPLLVGALMPKGNVYGALFAIRFIDAITLFAGAITGRLFLKSLNAWNWQGCMLIVLTLAGFCTHLAWSLRPERVALLVYILAALVVIRVRSRPVVQIICGAILNGFLGCAHPLGALMLTPIAVMYLSTREKGYELVRRVLLYGAITAAIFMILMAVSPYGIGPSLRGQLRMTQLLVVEGHPPELWEFRFHFATDPRQALLGVVLIAGCASGIAALRKYHAAIASPITFYAALAGLMVIIYYFILRKPATAYNFVPLFPYLAGLIIFQAAKKNSMTQRIVIPGAVLATNALSFARWILIFPIFLKSGVSLDEARSRFERLTNEASGRIGGTNIVWTFTEEYERLFDYPSNVPAIEAIEDRSYLVVQQFAYGSAAADPIPHHHIIENRFHSQSVRIMGINVANRMPDFAYAIYAPNEVSPTP